MAIAAPTAELTLSFLGIKNLYKMYPPNPVTITVNKPNKIPEAPACKILLKLSPAPKEKAKNGIDILIPGFKNSLTSLS